MSQALVAIPRLRFSEPCRNLPGRRGLATAEDRFTIAFMRAYLEQSEAIHRKARRHQLAFARQIPVNGYGIADLMVVAWEALPGETFPDARSFARVAKPCTRAFESKLTDWRRAMSQASRYRFFSNQAVVVLPPGAAERAIPFLATFRKIGVGLWSYCQETDRITAHFTPRATAAKSEDYYMHAIGLVASAATQVLPILQRGRVRPA
jgi:hypothetical protein